MNIKDIVASLRRFVQRFRRAPKPPAQPRRYNRCACIGCGREFAESTGAVLMHHPEIKCYEATRTPRHD